uniref:Metalloendopeptidase n=2 Tax=Strongyloides stercoralis TaxID=6248 RepID=A0AAF5I3F3_STRER
MKSIICIYISIIVLFMIIIKLLVKKENLLPDQIIVNSDIIFTDYHIDFKREIIKDLNYEWRSPIKYYIESGVIKENIEVAIEALKNNTCVTFKKENYIFHNESGIIFKEGPYCESYVGKQFNNQSQEIILTKECQKDPYIILHELGHALGLVHEHARNNREKYISIDDGQLDANGKNNFHSFVHSTFLNYNTEYDYASLMHYGPYTFGSWWYWLFVIFILIIRLWITNRNLLPDQIIVNNDIKFTDNHMNFKREIRKDMSNEWRFPINYSIDSGVNKKNIEVAMEILKNNTCVTFQEVKEIPENKSGIIFKERSYCESLVGKKDGNHSQEISLSKECQKDPLIILHEIGHALGLVHEHARNYRDKYVKIDYTQLNEIGQENFHSIYHTTYLSLETEYDYASLMHYGPYTFGSWWYWLWGWKVTTSKLNEQYDRMMGQRKNMTFNDFKRINLCHCNWCKWIKNGTNDRHPDREIWCKNGGYPDFKNCKRCLCPTGYTGDLCEEIIKSDDNCKNTSLKAEENVTTLIFNNKMTCYINIEVKLGWRIEVKILYVNAPYREKVCTEDIAYQFKYRQDRGATGLLLCGHHQKHMTLKSETNAFFIIYKGVELHISFILIIKHWITNRNLPSGFIVVNSDIVFSDNHMNFKREIRKNMSNEWRFPINYSIESGVNEKNIKVAMEILKNNTCVTFKKIDQVPENESGIIFKEGPYCESLVGKKDGNHSQEISLSKECQEDPLIILHELGHALGLVHEHARNDREKYISIDRSQLNQIGLDNFHSFIHKTYLSYDTEYDYASLMHYGPYTFGSWWYWLWGWKVMTSKRNKQYDRMMGQRKNMTFNDFKRVNLCHCNWCDWVENGTNYANFTARKIWCKNNGYPDFRNCSRCLCPTGYTGDLCDKVIKSDKKCGNTTFRATRNTTTLIFNDKMDCYIKVEVESRWRIEIKILYVNAPYRDKVCTEDIAYQFKYRKDRGATGLLLCGHHQKHMTLKSETNTSLIIYKGIEIHSLLVFQYKKKHWIANTNLPSGFIVVNSDIVFRDYHNKFKKDIRRDRFDVWLFPIRYYIQSSEMEKNLNIAISILNNNTCVTFKKEFQTFNDTQGLIFKEGSYCASYIGNVFENNAQEIILSKDCYKDAYTILHELGHALGLVHEHARKDRDKFITIHYHRMTEGGNNAFYIRNDSIFFNYSTTYDYAALMHYDPYSFTKGWYKFFGYPVIEPKLNEQYIYMMGQRKKMTFNDFKRINLCHCNWCKWVSNYTGEKLGITKTLCRNGGYPDFRNCKKCLCPTGYTGKFCQKIISSDFKCGRTSFIANKNGTSLIYNNNMTCHIFLKIAKKKKIEITILYVNAPVRQKYCTEDFAYQFKYMRDKGTTGLLLCGHHQKHMKLTSESNSVLVFYKGVELHSLLLYFYYNFIYIDNKTLDNKKKILFDQIIVYSSIIFTDDYMNFKREIKKNTSNEWRFSINYTVQPLVEGKNIEVAMEILKNNTCVTFHEVKKFFENESGVIFKEGSYCESLVRKKDDNRLQEIILTKQCQNDSYIILHELRHALGLVHEHARNDREKYISIDRSQLNEVGEKNFRSIFHYSFLSYDTQYDYASLMHYEPYTFSNWWHWLFGCQNCSRCLFPTGYTEDLCEKVMKSDGKCGNTTYIPIENVTTLIYNGKMNCYITVEAEIYYKIDFTILSVNAPYHNKICTEDIAYQSKYREDRRATGLLLYEHHQKHIKFESYRNNTLVFYKGIELHSLLVFQFKQGGIY